MREPLFLVSCRKTSHARALTGQVTSITPIEHATDGSASGMAFENPAPLLPASSQTTS